MRASLLANRSALARSSLAALLLLGLLLLGGCVDYEEEMWLDSDLGGRVAMTISVREELVQGNTGLERDLSEESIRRDLERIPGVKLESFKSYRDSGKRIAKLAIAFDSLEKLTRHEQGVAESKGVSLLGAIKVEQTGNKVRLQRVLPALPDARSNSWGGDLLMQGLGSLFLSNNYLSYKLHVPSEIITANTQRIDAPGKVVEWRFSLAQALRQPPEMTVEWERPSRAVWWILSVLAAAALIAAWFFLVRPRR